MAVQRRGTSTGRGKPKPDAPAPGPALDWQVLAGAKAKGKRPVFLTDADSERVLNIAMAIAMELAVTRERLDTLERLLEKKRVVKRAAIDAYVPGIAEGNERSQWHRGYIARILRIVQQEREAMADAGLNPDVGEIADELAKPPE